MDIISEDILKQLLERMDKMDNQQHKLDRLTERLDTLQNIIERQNQKQNLLDEKLVAITTKLQREKADMEEQLQEALQEIAEPIRGNDSKEGCPPSPHKTTQSLQSLGKQIGDRLKSIDDRTKDTAQMGQQLILLSRKMEDKLTELAGNSVEMKTFLVETRNSNDLKQGETKSELIVMNNLTDKKLSDISSVVSKIYQQQTEAKERTILSTEQPLKTSTQQFKQQDNTEPLSDTPKLTTTICDEQMQAVLDLNRKMEQINSSVLNLTRDVNTSLDTILTTNKGFITDLQNSVRNSIYEVKECSKEQSLLTNETFKSNLDKCFEVLQEKLQTNKITFITESKNQSGRIISAVETIKDHLGHCIQTEGENTNKYKAEVENFHSSVSSLLNKIQGNVKAVSEKVDCTEASMTGRHKTVINQLEDLSTHTQIKKLLETVNTDMQDYILTKTREQCAVTKKEVQTVRNGIEGPLMSLVEKIMAGSEIHYSRIISTVESAKEDLRHLIQTEGDNTNKYKVKLENLCSSVSSLLDGILGNVKGVIGKVDSTEASMISRHTTVIKQMEGLSTQAQMSQQLENLSTNLKDYIYLTKREIFAVTEKEAQIVRDRIQGPLVSLGNYTFDFYVENFKTLVRSGKDIESLPWYINELQTCVTGYVRMSTNGEMEVLLLYGRHPLEVGLQPRSDKTLKVKATICDIYNKKLQPLDIGEVSCSINEACILHNGGWGYMIGVTSCDVLLEKGYGQQEGYERGALLIRYDVTVV